MAAFQEQYNESSNQCDLTTSFIRCYVPATQRSEISRTHLVVVSNVVWENSAWKLGCKPSPWEHAPLSPSFPHLSQKGAHTHLKQNADYTTNILHIFHPSVCSKTAEKKFFVTSFSTCQVTGLLACALPPAEVFPLRYCQGGAHTFPKKHILGLRLSGFTRWFNKIRNPA